MSALPISSIPSAYASLASKEAEIACVTEAVASSTKDLHANASIRKPKRQSQQSFRTELASVSNGISKLAGQRILSGQLTDALHRDASVATQLLQRSHAESATQRALYNQSAAEESRKLNEVDAKIQNATLPEASFRARFASLNPNAIADPFAPETSSEIMVNGMRAVNVLSTPHRVIGAGMAMVCQASPNVCQVIEKGVQAVKKQVKKLPGVVALAKKVKEGEERVKEGFAKEFGISEKTTEYALDSAKLLVGSAVGAVAIKSVMKTGKAISEQTKKMQSGGVVAIAQTTERTAASSHIVPLTVTAVEGNTTEFIRRVETTTRLNSDKTAFANVDWVCNTGYSSNFIMETVNRLKNIAVNAGAEKLVIQANFLNRRLEQLAIRKLPNYNAELSQFELSLNGVSPKPLPLSETLSLGRSIRIQEIAEYKFTISCSDTIKTAIAKITSIYSRHSGESYKLLSEIREKAAKAGATKLELQFGQNINDLNLERYLKILDQRYKRLGNDGTVYRFEVPIG